MKNLQMTFCLMKTERENKLLSHLINKMNAPRVVTTTNLTSVLIKRRKTKFM